MKFLLYVRKALFPFFCSFCKSFDVEDESLCALCLSCIAPVVTCPLKVTQKYSVKVFAVGQYKEPLRALVRAKQYGNRKAARELGLLLWQRTDIRFASFDVIIPVPLHWSRYAWRWFNQAEEMAKVLSKQSGKPLIHALTRNKITSFQAGLSRQKRAENVRGVFACTSERGKLKGKDILLVDDVMTTGATLKEAIRELRTHKPRSITIAVGCRVIL